MVVAATPACSRPPTWPRSMRPGWGSSSVPAVTKAPDRPGVAFPLARRRFHRRAGHRHRHTPARQQQGQQHRHCAPNRCGTPRTHPGRGGRSGHTQPNAPPRQEDTRPPRRTAPARSSPATSTAKPAPVRQDPRQGPRSSMRPRWPAPVAGRPEGLRHQHRRHGDARGRGDHQLPRPVARRAVIPDVQDRPAPPGPCSTAPATRSRPT